MHQETDRGVSDLIAFVLMFAIIITGVGIVSLGAFGNLTEFSEREQVENSERGLSAMASTLDEFHRQSDTYRSEIKLALSGSQAYFNPSSLDVTIGGGPTKTYDLNATEQRFDRPDEDIVVSYEGGGVFRRPGFDARYPPSMECKTGTSGTDVAIVSFVTIQAGNFGISRGSEDDTTLNLNKRGVPGESPVADLDTTLIFDARLDGQNRTYDQFPSPTTVTVDVGGTANPGQWNDYFDRDGSDWVNPSGTQWECQNVDAVLVRQTVVELSL